MCCMRVLWGWIFIVDGVLWLLVVFLRKFWIFEKDWGEGGRLILVVESGLWVIVWSLGFWSEVSLWR